MCTNNLSLLVLLRSGSFMEFILKLICNITSSRIWRTLKKPLTAAAFGFVVSLIATLDPRAAAMQCFPKRNSFPGVKNSESDRFRHTERNDLAKWIRSSQQMIDRSSLSRVTLRSYTRPRGRGVSRETFRLAI